MPIFSAVNVPMAMDGLLQLGVALKASGYAFTTVTPATHARVNARGGNRTARNLTDVFGWNRPFKEAVLPPRLVEAMHCAQLLDKHPEGWISRVRASTLRGQLFLHSAYPTTAADAVFFGPDSYRFANAIARFLAQNTTGDGGRRRAVDIGCGAGPGAVMVALAWPDAEVVAVDINDLALRYTAVNAELAGVPGVVVHHSDLLGDVGEAGDGDFDLIVANPPYLLDARERIYRHGGGNHGEGLSLAIVDLAATRLAPGGTLLLYTGTAIIDGVDRFLGAVESHLGASHTSLSPLRPPNLTWDYQELDPDVFGEELDEPAYAEADRIAAVLLTVRRARS